MLRNPNNDINISPIEIAFFFRYKIRSCIFAQGHKIYSNDRTADIQLSAKHNFTEYFFVSDRKEPPATFFGRIKTSEKISHVEKLLFAPNKNKNIRTEKSHDLPKGRDPQHGGFIVPYGTVMIGDVSPQHV